MNIITQTPEDGMNPASTMKGVDERNEGLSPRVPTFYDPENVNFAVTSNIASTIEYVKYDTDWPGDEVYVITFNLSTLDATSDAYYDSAKSSSAPTTRTISIDQDYQNFFRALPITDKEFMGWYTFPRDASSFTNFYDATEKIGYEPKIYYGTQILPNAKKVTISGKNYYLICARYRVNIKITWRGNGGPSTNTITYNLPGSTFGTLPSPTRTGYRFDGWYPDETFTVGTEIHDYTTVPDAPTTYYGKWTRIYTVTWDGNGGTPATQTSYVVAGDTVGVFPEVTPAEGYFFDWWYTQKTGGSAIEAFTTPTSDVTYYARWVKGNKITWDAHGGEIVGAGSGVTTTITYYDPRTGMRKPFPEASRSGYKFKYWYDPTVNPSSWPPYEIYESYAPGDNATLYALWEGPQVNILLDAEEGYIPASEMSRISYSGYPFKTKIKPNTNPVEVDAFPLPQPSNLSNWTFRGWSTSNSISGIINDNTEIPLSSSGLIVLTAIWDKGKITIYYDANGGSVSPSSKSVDYGTETYGDLPTPTYSGHKFTGWYTLSVGGERVIPNTPLGNFPVTIYAHWEAISYHVYIYETSDTTVQPVIEHQVNSGESFYVQNITRSGYKFTGWRVVDGLTTSTAKYGSTIKPTTSIPSSSFKCIIENQNGVWFLDLSNQDNGSVNIIATWNAAEYTLRVAKNWGDFSIQTITQKLIYRTKNNNTINVLSRTGYTLNGYYDTAISDNTSSLPASSVQVYNASGKNLSNKYWTAAYSSGLFRGTSDLTVYAKWTGKWYSFNYDNLFIFEDWQSNSNSNRLARGSGSLTVNATGSGTITIKNTGTSEATTGFTTQDGEGGAYSYYSIQVTGNTSYTIFWKWTARVTTETPANRTQILIICYTDNTISGQHISNSTVTAEGTLTGSSRIGAAYKTFTTPSNCTACLIRFDNETPNSTAEFTEIRFSRTEPYKNIYQRFYEGTLSLTTDSMTHKRYQYSDNPSVTFGSGMVQSNTMLRTGYSFIGWYTSEWSGGTEISATTPKNTLYQRNRTVYSRWTNTKTTITYMGNGGYYLDGSTRITSYSQQQENNRTSFNLEANRFSKSYFDFLGWSLAPSGQVVYDDGAVISSTTSLVLYAIWQPQVMYLFFDANGGTLPSYNDKGTENGGARTREDNLRVIRKGTKISWSYNIFPLNKFRTISAGVSIDSSSLKISGTSGSSASYYQFNPYENPYIPAKVNGKTANYTLIFEVVSVTSSKKNFSRWLISESNTASSYQSQFETTWWEVPSSTAKVESLLAYASGREMEAESSTAPTKRHYLAHSNIGIPANKSGEARIRVSVFGGTSIALSNKKESSQVAYKYVTPFTESIYNPLPVPTRNGYTFKGWFPNASGTGTERTNDTTNLYTSTTLYAKWEKVTRTVSFNANGGTGTMTAITVDSYPIQTITLPKNSFTLTNYEFLGWATSPNGMVSYSDEDSISVSENIVLYAVWQRMAAIVRFDANGGTLPSYTDEGTAYHPGADTPVRVTLEDNMRVVLAGRQLGENANIFPSNDKSNFVRMSSFATLTDNEFHFSYDNTNGTSSVNISCPAKEIQWLPTDISYGYTCIVEILSASNTDSIMIQMASADSSSACQLRRVNWNLESVEEGKIYYSFTQARATGDVENKYFAYAFIRIPARKKADVTLRFSIFAGSVVSPIISSDEQTLFSYTPPFTGIFCSLPMPTRSGYIFRGWFTNTWFTGIKHTESTVVPSGSNLFKYGFLYANWLATYTLTFMTDNGISSIQYSLVDNLFDIMAWRSNTYSFAVNVGNLGCSLAGTGTITIDNTSKTEASATKASTAQGAGTTYYTIPVSPNTNYTLTWEWTGNSTSTRVFVYSFTDATSQGTNISGGNANAWASKSSEATVVGHGTLNFTTPSNGTVIQVRFSNNTFSSTSIFSNIYLYKTSISYTETASNGTSITVPQGTLWYAYSIAKSGYTSINPASNPKTGFMPNANTTVTFESTGKTYNVIFNPNGGTFEGRTTSTTKQVEYQSNSLATVGVATRTGGYYFQCWCIDPADPKTAIYDYKGKFKKNKGYFDNSGRWIKQSNVTVYASWTSPISLYDIEIS